MTGALAVVIASCFLLLGPAHSTSAAQGWGGYLPEKQRKDILKKARKREVTMDGLIGGTIIDTIWVTRDVARAAVSLRIDDERITVDEAERLYAALRPADRYLVHVRYSTLPDGPELNENGLFLQRAGAKDIFTRGKQVNALVFDSGIRTTVQDNQIILEFSKTSENGAPIVRSMDEKIEVSIKTQYKKPSVTEYAVKDLVRDLVDL